MVNREGFENSFIAPATSNADAEADTGVAVQNLEESAITFSAELLDSSGNLLARASFMVRPNGHTASFITQLNWDPVVDFTDFSGILRVSSAGLRFAATVLLTRPGQLASLPWWCRPWPRRATIEKIPGGVLPAL